MRTYRIGDLGRVVTGETPSASNDDSWGDEVEFITPSDQAFGMRRAAPARKLSLLGAQRHKQRLVPAGSTNLTCIGATIGKVTQASSTSLTNQQINSIIPNPEICDADYLYYHIKNWSPVLARDAVGSATPIVNKTTLSNYHLMLPRLSTQKAIAEVLGALDDKMASNARIIELVTEYADSLYQAAPKTRGDTTFADLGDIGGGGTPSTKNPSFWNGEVPWATPSDVTSLDGPWLLDTDRHISLEGLTAITSKLHHRATVIMSSRASIGHTALLSQPTAINQGFIAIVPHDKTLAPWLYAQLRARTQEFLAWANGATFLELPKGVFRLLPVDMPVDDWANRYEAAVQPALARAEAAQKESQTLAKTRDELLPLLMNGKITVREAEQQVEEVV